VRGPLALCALLLLAPPVVAQTAAPGAGPPAAAAATPAPAAEPASFEALWAARTKALAAGDAAAAQRALREIGRLRVERNVESLDTVGLALVEDGMRRLDAAQVDEGSAAFESAVALAPGLPDGYDGLARARLKRSALGLVSSIRASFTGIGEFLDTARGSMNAANLAGFAGLLLGFAVTWAVAIGLLLRRGGLLRHDIEEWLGPAQTRSASLALFLLVLFLPVATFQGWGWLPVWWMAVLFAYLGRTERIVAGLLVLLGLAVGPQMASLELRFRTARNPLYHAALATVEGVPDGFELARLQRAAEADPEDRDLGYLLAVGLKKVGRYAEAEALYRQMLAADPQNAIARNNLANLLLLRGGYEDARALYEAGTRPGTRPDVAATSFYNLSLAHLRKFDYQAYNEARANADRLAKGLVGSYDRWKYEWGDYASVDLGLTRAQVWAKFAGATSGVAARNVASGEPAAPSGVLLVSMANRFAASVAIFGLVAWLFRWIRGPRAFTLHCARCGTAFCRHCHLGPVSGGLCSQCYHLFVVRDGVSGPARNRKMREVQEKEGRRGRVFRVLSVVSPGAGQIFAGSTILGVLLLVAWYGVLAAVAAGRVLPFTEVAGRVNPPWFAVAAVLGLLAVWLVANRLQPDFGTVLPARPGGPRRARVPQGAG
jgi:Tfp pilus assembly protein PilF